MPLSQRADVASGQVDGTKSRYELLAGDDLELIEQRAIAALSAKLAGLPSDRPRPARTVVALSVTRVAGMTEGQIAQTIQRRLAAALAAPGFPIPNIENVTVAVQPNEDREAIKALGPHKLARVHWYFAQVPLAHVQSPEEVKRVALGFASIEPGPADVAEKIVEHLKTRGGTPKSIFKARIKIPPCLSNFEASTAITERIIETLRNLGYWGASYHLVTALRERVSREATHVMIVMFTRR